MSGALRQALQCFCTSQGWTYAVFWRAKCRNKTILMWEDGYSDLGNTDGDPKIQGINVPDLLMAISKMSYHVYTLGEGLVGRVALSGRYHWVFLQNLYKSDSQQRFKHPFQDKFPAGWQQQFEHGVKTIVLIPVPGGVLQLGSVAVIPETEKTLVQARSIFSALQKIPGAFMSDFVPEDGGSMLAPENPTLVSSFTKAQEASMSRPPRVSLSDISKRPGAKQLLATTAAQHMSRQILADNSRRRQHTFPPIPVNKHDSANSATLSGHGQSLFNTNRQSLPLFSAEGPFPIDQVPLKAFGNNSLSTWSPKYHAMQEGIPYNQTRHMYMPFSQQRRQPSITDVEDSWLRKQGLVEGKAAEQASYLDDEPSDSFWPPMESREGGTGLLGDVVAHSASRTKIEENNKPWEAYAPMCGSNTPQQQSSDMVTLPAFVPPAPVEGEFAGEDLAEMEEQATLEVLRNVGYLGTPATMNTSNTSGSQFDGFGDFLLDAPLKACQETEETICSSEGRCAEGEVKQKVSEEPVVVPEKAASPTAEGLLLEISKSAKKRGPGTSKARPRDRQLIQDRLKELRDIIPYSHKCSIDSLLEKTMLHMQFVESALSQKRKFDDVEGSSLPGQVESSQAPFIIKNLPSVQNHFVVQVSCESKASPLLITDCLCKLGLIVRRSNLQSRNGKLSGICIVEFTMPIQKAEVLWELTRAVRPNGVPHTDFGVDQPPKLSRRFIQQPFTANFGTLQAQVN